MNMTGVSNWEVLHCREFTNEAFVEMVLRLFCIIISLLILVNIVSELVKFAHIGRMTSIIQRRSGASYRMW